jgi:hypothetical protein
MLYISQIIIANQDVQSFDEFLDVIRDYAQQGERFLRFDVKPPYPDTPENWEDRVESAFSGRI